MIEQQLTKKYIPTCNLRVLLEHYGDHKVQVLQQEFISALDGKSEWRNIPIVVNHIEHSEF